MPLPCVKRESVANNAQVPRLTAAALREAGIPCRFQEEGWFASPIVLTACQALAYLADHEDRHAALCLAVTGFGGHTLESALKVMVSGGDITDSPLHKALRNLALRTAEASVGQTLLEIITELKMYETIAAWEDAPQARANLLRLQAECREFENANRDALACGGYYGNGIKTFLAWLKQRVEIDDRQPPPLVHDQDAVELVTWHSSKGREWPVVVVCGLYSDYVKNYFPELQVTYPPDAFNNLDTILQKAAVQIVPAFASPESSDRMKTLLQEEAEKSATRLLYVALTRAREKLIIEWPSWTIGSKTRTSRFYVDLFVDKTKARLVTETTGKNFMQFGESFKFPCHLMTVTRDKGHWSCTDPLTVETVPPIGRNVVKPGIIDHSRLVEEEMTPSSRHGLATAPILRGNYKYGSEINIKLPGVTDAAEKGKILHRAFEVLTGHPERTLMLSDAVGLELPKEAIDSICRAVLSFDTWLASELKPVAVSTEVPLLALMDETVVHGFVDMLVETADGFWIVDHKSDQLEESEIPARAAYYYPQLAAYAEAVSKLHSVKPVQGMMINWISLGMVSVVGAVSG